MTPLSIKDIQSKRNYGALKVCHMPDNVDPSMWPQFGSIRLSQSIVGLTDGSDGSPACCCWFLGQTLYEVHLDFT